MKEKMEIDKTYAYQRVGNLYHIKRIVSAMTLCNETIILNYGQDVLTREAPVEQVCPDCFKKYNGGYVSCHIPGRDGIY